MNDAVDQAISRENLDALIDLPGSFQLLISTPGMLRAYTDAAGLRRLFYAGIAAGC